MKHHVYRVLAALAVVALIIGGCVTPTPTPATQPTAEQKPAEQKPAEVKPTEAKPTEPPAEVKPTEPPAPPAAKYKEAPDLAKLVADGKLPPVEQRLPDEPRVVTADSVGQYGGVWRRGFIGPSDYNGYVRVVYDSLVVFSPDGGSIEPKVALGWENSSDYKSWTVKLRKGAK